MSEPLSSHSTERKRSEKPQSGFSMNDSLSFILTDPKADRNLPQDQKHPWFRLFEQGKDLQGRDLNPTLDFLKFARAIGRKQIRPEEDKAPGLTVTFRGIELSPSADNSTYTLKLVGEFNATEVQLTKDDVQNLFDGRMTVWTLTNETSRSTGSTRYIVKTDLKIRLSLENKILKIHSLEGSGTITTIGFLSKETYESAKVQLGNPKGIGVLFEGRQGELLKLPLIK